MFLFIEKERCVCVSYVIYCINFPTNHNLKILLYENKKQVNQVNTIIALYLKRDQRLTQN